MSVQQLPTGNPLIQAMIRAEIERRQEERARARNVPSSSSDQEAQRRIREATRTTAQWMRNHTRTFNPHWVEEGRERPDEPFPDWYFFEPMTEMLEREKMSAIEKSRDMMASWGVVAYFTLQAQRVPRREIVFQSIAQDEAEQLIKYSKALWDSQEPFLKEAFPLEKPLHKQPVDSITFANGSVIWSVPAGKDKIRSYHPWGYFQDESGFQPEGLQCIDAALGTGCQKIVLASTANIGWYADYRKDAAL